MTEKSVPQSDSGMSAMALALPRDSPLRTTLHNEIHARPTGKIEHPALVSYLAVFNAGVTLEQECALLRRFPGYEDLSVESLRGNFLYLKFPRCRLKWERHTEFTRYTLVQPLQNEEVALVRDSDWGSDARRFFQDLPLDWWAAIPGETFAAIELMILPHEIEGTEAALSYASTWFSDKPLFASQLGRQGYALAVSDFWLRPNGVERMIVLTRSDVQPRRASRVVTRLLEFETYRLMALQGLPVAKGLQGSLKRAEAELAAITQELEQKNTDEQQLLDRLVSLAVGIERANAEHGYRFAATRAYDGLVRQRSSELREASIPSYQRLGDFMQHRLSPAIATVEATEKRLAFLSDRVAQTADLLRTQVNIATEAQNQQLLEQLTKGQALQLKLQSMVEGLSIAAISYYILSLLLYGLKAGKAAGLPIKPELIAGLMIPVVLVGVWVATKRIHKKLHENR